MDLDDQAGEAWLLSVQRKLYQWSRTHPEDKYRDLWNWITDIRKESRRTMPMWKASMGRYGPSAWMHIGSQDQQKRWS